MHKLLLAVVASLGLMTHVQAADQATEHHVRNLHHKNFMGQRPYTNPEVNQQSRDDRWEGTGLVTDTPDKNMVKHQQMRLNFIGKRPFTGSTRDAK